ncbi:phage tail protein [Sporolactobacillus sp. STCC-11]|uniref:phage tail protein n=1 Tax=Sporolactobacillus caesalpiniae TaxID=3230362 RepID=UPI0033935725
MRDLLIKNLEGKIERLTDYSVTRKRTVNAEKSIDVTVYQTDRNAHAYPMIANECELDYEHEPYIIKLLKERTIGKTVAVTITATHKIYDQLANNYIYGTITGTFTLEAMLQFLLEGSGIAIELSADGLPHSVTVENFGDDDSFSLLKSALDKFGAEYQPVANKIHVAKELGKTTDYQLRYKFNISDPEKSIDTSSLKTYIRGYGKQNEDGSYVAQIDYTSPLASVPGIGIRHAKPVRDDRFTNNDTLLAYCMAQLTDSINISIDLTYVELRDAGIQDIDFGDYVWCIIEPFGIKTRIRVMAIEDYSNEKESPKFTLGELRRTATQVISGITRASRNISTLSIRLDDTIKVANTAYDDRIISTKVGEIND